MAGAARLQGAPGSPATLSQTLTIDSNDYNKLHVLRCNTRVIQTRVVNGLFQDDIQFWDDRSSGSGTVKWDGGEQALQLRVPENTTDVDKAQATQKVSVNTRYRNMKHTLRVVTGAIGTGGTLKAAVGSTPLGSDIVGEDTLSASSTKTYTFTPGVETFYVRFTLTRASGTPTAFIKQCYIVNHLTADQGLPNGGKVTIKKSSDNSVLATRNLVDGRHLVSFTAPEENVVVEFSTEGEMWVESVDFTKGGPQELDTPYADEDVAEIQLTQSADVMYLASPKFTPRKLLRYGDNDWALAVYDPARNPFSEGGKFPGSVCFFDQRLLWGGPVDFPQSVWASRVDDYENLIIGTADDDAFQFTLSTGRGNKIITMVPMSDKLFIGTGGSEHLITGSQQKVIGPKNMNMKRPSSFGTEPRTQGRQFDASAGFIERGGLRLRLLVYDFQSDAFKATDISVLADHFSEQEMENSTGADRSFVDAVYQAAPYPIIYVRRNDGRVMAVTFNQQQEVVAWSRLRFGGTLGPDIQPKVLSMAVIPHPSANGQQTWLIISRLINGSVKRYVEFFGEYEGSYYRQLLVDSGITGSFETPQTTISGLDHLEGQTVAILGDGNTYPEQTVTGGQITLNPGVKTVEVGLKYKPIMETLPLDLMEGFDTTAHLPRSQPLLYIDVRNTQGLIVNGQTDIGLRDVANPMDEPAPLFTGTVDVSTIGFSRQDKVRIEQDSPKPAEILALTGAIKYGER